MILTWFILIPAIGGIAAFIGGLRNVAAARYSALIASIGIFGLSLALWIQFPFSLEPSALTRSGAYIDYNLSWIPELGISYHLAMDGLNLILVMLTALIGIAAVACSWREINYKVGEFHLALMTLLAAIMGTFLAFDLLLFYLFWELMLIPMYFLISLWGHSNRHYAAMKFFLFTFIGGFMMLVGILGIYMVHGRATGVYTFDYYHLLRTPIRSSTALWLMLGFFVGLGVKMPIIPAHTWLPDAHTEAPTAGSVDLAGLLLKTGAYGMIRFAIPLFPFAAARVAPVAELLAVAGILYGGLLAFPQLDFKRMVAYTSISHMGFVLLGIYAGNEIALQGAVLEIVAHGLTTGALFLIVGMVQERTFTRELDLLGGLWATTPKIGGFTLFFALGALGLPGLGNFAGEFLVLLGTFQVNRVLAAIAALGLVFSVIYALRLVQTTVLGPNRSNWFLPDLSPRELAILGSLAALVLWLGLYPQPIFNTARGALRPVQHALSAAEMTRAEDGR